MSYMDKAVMRSAKVFFRHTHGWSLFCKRQTQMAAWPVRFAALVGCFQPFA